MKANCTLLVSVLRFEAVFCNVEHYYALLAQQPPKQWLPPHVEQVGAAKQSVFSVTHSLLGARELSGGSEKIDGN